MKRQLILLAALGLALGAVFGLAGTFVSNPILRSIFWGIDSVGLIMATVILSLKYERKTCDALAVGFLIFALGEAEMLGGTAGGPGGSVSSFAAGTALWATALLFVSIPRELPPLVRTVGIISAILFYITAAQIFAGVVLLPVSAPLPYFAYPFLALTFIGWIWVTLREA